MSEMDNKILEAEEEEDNLVELTDENGETAQFEYLDCIELYGKEYVVLLPVEDEEPEVVILAIEPVEGSEEEENYVAVESEEILQQVYEIFKERFKDVFQFEE